MFLTLIYTKFINAIVIKMSSNVEAVWMWWFLDATLCIASQLEAEMSGILQCTPEKKKKSKNTQSGKMVLQKCSSKKY